MTYRNIRKAGTRTKLDRDTWAGISLLVVSYDTEGVGSTETELLDFGTVFEEPPVFSWGVEAAPGQEIFEGDYPAVSCGVIGWETTEVEEDSRAIPYYLGAYAWLSVASGFPYKLRFRLSFEGTTLRNVEYFRGLNG
jgi:hypothetical protein